MSIYENVIKLCNQHKTTKTALEEACGFSQNSINKWKASSPSIKNLIKVADHFGVSVDFLLGREILQTEEAVPTERLNSDILTIEDIELMIANNDGLDWIEKLYKELKDKQQRLYVLTWLMAYMASEGLPVNQILGK